MAPKASALTMTFGAKAAANDLVMEASAALLMM
jgi:hypothetical protein